MHVLNPRFVGMDHFADNEVKRDCEEVLTDMLPSFEDVSTALDEYHEYHGKKGRFESKLLWVRAERVSPAELLAAGGAQGEVAECRRRDRAQPHLSVVSGLLS